MWRCLIRVCERSGASTISPPRSEHLIMTPRSLISETPPVLPQVVLLPTTGLGYKKFVNSLELSYSTVARVILRFSKTGFTRNRPRKGRSKKCSQVQKLASKNRRMSAASIALAVAEVKGQLVSAQTIRHTLQQVRLHGCRPRRKPLLKLAHKKSLQTVFWRQPGQEYEFL